MLAFIRVVLGAVLIFWAVGVGPLCWILRDGLGPGSIASQGLKAVVRLFFTFYWGPILVVLSALWLVCHRRSQAREAGMDETSYPEQS